MFGAWGIVLLAGCSRTQHCWTPKQTGYLPPQSSITGIYPVGEMTLQPVEKSKTDVQQANRLDRTIDLATLTPQTTLAEAVDILRNSTAPPLNIVVFWADLHANAGIERDTPVGMQPVCGVSLRTNLELLLMSVSAGRADLGYTVTDGIIVIATKGALPKKMVTGVYDISDLSARPADYHSSSGAGRSGY